MLAFIVASMTVVSAVSSEPVWASLTNPPGSPMRDLTLSFATASPGIPAGMRRVFSDSFAGSSLNTSKWETCYPWAIGRGCSNFGNSELEWYLPSQSRVSGRALHLVAVETPTQGRTTSGESTVYPWRSGMVTTFSSFSFTYGYVQVIARIPHGAGYWPALWLLPHDRSFPPEIDIQESYDFDTFQTVPNFHAAGNTQHRGPFISPTDLAVGWHTYSLSWNPGSLTWFVDGKAVFSYAGPDVPSKPMYFLADLAVWGKSSALGPNASTPARASFDIRSVTIYQSRSRSSPM